MECYSCHSLPKHSWRRDRVGERDFRCRFPLSGSVSDICDSFSAASGTKTSMSGWKVKRSSVLRARLRRFRFRVTLRRTTERKKADKCAQGVAAELETRQFVINSAISSIETPRRRERYPTLWLMHFMMFSIIKLSTRRF